MDDKLADFFFGCSVSFRTVESPFFVNFIKAVKESPHPYKAPARITLADKVLKRKHAKVIKSKMILLNDTNSVMLVDGKIV